MRGGQRMPPRTTTSTTHGPMRSSSATFRPAACSRQCGAPGNFRVQYQDSDGHWNYFATFSDQRNGIPFTDLNGEARPPDAKMNSLMPPVETKHMRLRFTTWEGEKVAVRASIRGCLAS